MQTPSRAEAWAALETIGTSDGFDVLVIGGGATGLGVAVDAAARGFRVALVEAVDFGKGTSSRSTKLVHGGVRYLAQGRIGLVREALAERASLLGNAPHLASALPFVMPARGLVDRLFYGTGLRLYGALAGSRNLGPTEGLSAAQTAAALPGLSPSVHAGGVRYWDAQFDDARLAVALARTAVSLGAVVLNHAPVVGLLRGVGAEVLDRETGRVTTVRARCVINATGVWVDALRQMDAEHVLPHQATGACTSIPSSAKGMVTPSQGVHLVVDASFLGGHHALLVPRTSDGRVVFAVPWLGHVILGTTDTPRSDLPLEPLPLPEEVDFILREAGRYLRRTPTEADVKSVWVGLRPLVAEESGSAKGEEGSRADGSRTEAATGSISREHTVLVDPSGLITVTGGKWTTYRSMAEDVLEHAFNAELLPRRAGGVTERLPLKGAVTGATTTTHHPRPISDPPGLHLYGAEAESVAALPGADRWLWRHHAADREDSPFGLSEAMVRFAVRHEMARTVEDVLARRSRLLFLDAARAAEVAPDVAALLSEELGDAPDASGLQDFLALARQYAHLPQR